MPQKDARIIQAELAKPFAAEDLEWRLQRTFESKGDMIGIAVPYVTNRAIMNRLDNVVGPENWYNDFKPWHRFTARVKSDYDPKKFVEKEVISQLCGIAIYFEERKKWIMKWDGAENSDIEPAKGGLSDSMKRAAVQWGIGRVLYNIDTVLVDVEPRGKSWIMKKSERSKLDKLYLKMLKELKLEPAPAGGIQSLLVGHAIEPEEQPEETPRKGFTPAIPPREEKNTQEKPPVEKRTAQKAAAQSAPEPPGCAYIVTAMRINGGMKTSNTSLKLNDMKGKEISAFAQGEHPLLVPGTRLSAATLTTRQQDTVVYYVLESYQIAESQGQAA